MTRQFLKQTLTLVTAAFSLVAALAWNSAIQGLIQRIYPEKAAGLKSEFLYAVVITLVTVLVTIWFGSIDKRIEKAESRKSK